MSWPKSKNIEEMHALYMEGHSTRQVGKVFGVTGQSVYGLFKYNNKPMRKKPKPLEFIEFNGNKYTMRNTGYYGRTNDKRSLLHRDIWEYHHGQIPTGWDVHHKDENKEHNVIENFECLSKSDHTQLHSHGQNQHTAKRKAVPCGS